MKVRGLFWVSQSEWISAPDISLFDERSEIFLKGPTSCFWPKRKIMEAQKGPELPVFFPAFVRQTKTSQDLIESWDVR